MCRNVTGKKESIALNKTTINTRVHSIGMCHFTDLGLGRFRLRCHFKRWPQTVKMLKPNEVMIKKVYPIPQ